MEFETERLTIRRFKADDWRDLQVIAVSKEASPFADCDERWPTTDDECRGMASFFAEGEQFWAVELRASHRVVCFVNFNGMDERKVLDIGHVMNAEYLHSGYESEALRVLYDYGFGTLGAEAVQAGWALADADKIGPLKELGMRVVRVSRGPRLRCNSDGVREEFEGCVLLVTRDEWQASGEVPMERPTRAGL